MELSLTTEDLVAIVAVKGALLTSDGTKLASYLELARANGAVRCVVDLSDCERLDTAVVALLLRQADAFLAAGGVLALAGLAAQNPFMSQARPPDRMRLYRTRGDAVRNLGTPTGDEVARVDGPGGAA